MGPKLDREALREILAAELATITGEQSGAAGTAELLRRHPELLGAETVENLAEMAREMGRVDAQQSLGLAEAALSIAQTLGDEGSQARGLRAKANALWFLNHNRQAVELYEQAIELY